MPKPSVEGIIGGCIALLLRRRLTDLKYVDEIILLASNVQAAGLVNCSTTEVILNGMHFASAKFKVLFLDCRRPASALYLEN